MRCRIPTFAVLVVLLGLVSAAAADAHQEARYRVQQDVLLGEVTDWRGHPVQLGVDLYVPLRRRAPLLLWLHGGGFSVGSRREGEALGRALAARGFAVASIDYRLRTSAEIARRGIAPALADARADVATAVAWVRRNAAELSVDPDRIAIGGHSAGALTALSLAANARRVGVRPCLVASVAGGLEASKVRAGMPPAAFFHAAADPVAPRGFALAAFEALRARGVRTWWVDLPGESHTPGPDVYAGLIAPRLSGFLRAACG